MIHNQSRNSERKSRDNMKIVLWGLGYIYNQIKNSLSYFELSNQIEIVGATASYRSKESVIDGYTIYPCEKLMYLDFDYIVILSDNYFEDIAETAFKLGISKEKLLSYKLFLIPNINLKEYILLKDQRISILSNNCWGGVVYSTLGLECMSPTKNLFFEDKDYIKFIKNIELYLKETPTYSRDGVDVNSFKTYPVLKLKDIEIHCNHSNSPEAAINDWVRRANKINLNNLFVQMYTDKEDVAKEFLEIPGLIKKYCFVPWEDNHECTIYVDLNQANLKPWEVILATATLKNEVFKYDLIKLLSGEKKLRIK